MLKCALILGISETIPSRAISTPSHFMHTTETKESAVVIWKPLTPNTEV